MSGLIAHPREQAQENYLRNGRGNPGQWFEHKADYRPPPGQPRVRPEARDIAEKNKPTISSTLHEFKAKEDPEKPPVRLRDPEAVQIADKFNYQEDKWFDFAGNYAFRPKNRAPKVYHQGAEIVEKRNQQRSGEWFDHTKAPDNEEYVPMKVCTSQMGKSIAANDKAPRPNFLIHDPKQETAARPASRTRPEGQDYADRNHYGSASQWMGQGGNRGEPCAEPDYGELQPRCTSPQAVENYERARGSGMKTCFDHRGAQPDPPPNARVRGEAAEQAYKQSRGSLGQGQPRPMLDEPTAPRVRPEAQQSYARNQGSLGNYLDQSKNKDYNSPRPQPRIKSGAAQENAHRNAGLMGTCLSKTEYRAPSHPSKIHPRGGGTGDAKTNAAAAKGGSTKSILENYRLPPEAPPKARTTTGGQEFAERNKGSVGGVLGGYGRHAPDSPPPMRVKPEAAENMERNRGTGLFKVMQQAPPSNR